MKKRAAVSLALLLIGVGTLAAQHVNVPLQNWTVPPYMATSAGGGLSTMTDISGQRAFVAISPCRIADTRGIDGFTGQAGGPALTSFFDRNFQISGSPGGIPGPPASCAAGTVPVDADAVSVQITVVTPTSAGNLVAWQAGAAPPNVSVLNWDAGTIALGNGTIIPLSGGGAMAVRLNTGGAGQQAHVIIDVNGYFSESSSSTTANLQVYSTITTHTILGNNTGGGNGVEGISTLNVNNRAGVFGRQGFFSLQEDYSPAGVRGQGPFYGVAGISSSEGVTGGLVNLSGFELTYGILGSAVGTDPGCVGGGACGGPWAVFGGGNIGATGTKHFLEPHPSDPKVAIGYISLEGPEAGTYFRGRARFQNGTARIAVPEHFRLVTDPEGLTVQITPIGGMATVGVLRADLNEIVVQASRNLEFSYLVQGVRASFKDVSPYRFGNDFMPRSAKARIPLSLSPRQKELLIENGTYNADGTVNMETARRAGWARIWEDRERPTPAPSPE
jgi:hypothetical protein